MASIIEKTYKKPIDNKGTKKLTYKEVRFIDEYILNGGNGMEAARSAGYVGDNKQLSQKSQRLLSKSSIISEIEARKAEIHSATILSATDILELYSKIARGEVLDQFGLDASLRDRISAMNQLAKYQIEMPMKLAERQQQDREISIKLIRD